MVDYKYKDLYNKPHIDKQMKIIACDFVGYYTPENKYPAKLEYEGKVYLDAETNYYYKCRKEGISYSWKKVEHEYELIVFKNSDIDWENFELSESLCSESELRFGCCEASILKFRIHNTFVPLKDKWLTVTEVLEGNTDSTFQFGRYKVFSDVPTADRLYRDVTAYDAMYDIINSSAINWYNSILPDLSSWATMKYFRTSFIEYFGLKQQEITLVNDDMMVQKTIQVEEGTEVDNEAEQVSILKESSLSGLDVIRAICEINGCFGHIGRDGKFHYIYLEQDIMGLYPSNTLFPDHAPWYLKQSETGHLYPQDPKSTGIGIGGYKSCQYEDFICKKITKLQIRQEENDIGKIWPEGDRKESDNCYIIENNFLVYGKASSHLRIIAKNIFEKIKDVVYRPFLAECIGNPCLEVGDPVRLPTRYELVETYILNRTLKGIQGLGDSYSANGAEKYSQKVNGVHSSIIQLKSKANILKRTIEETRSELIDSDAGLNSLITQTAGEIREEVKNTKEGLESSISQTAESITSTVSKATSKYDTTGYNVELFGYFSPDDERMQYKASENNGKYYLNQSDGSLYRSNGTSWIFVKKLEMITENLSSEIKQTADSIISTVARTEKIWSEKEENGNPIKIDKYGFGAPSEKMTAEEYSPGLKYLDQTSGMVYEAMRHYPMENPQRVEWRTYRQLEQVSATIRSEIKQTADSIISTVENTEEELSSKIEQKAGEITSTVAGSEKLWLAKDENGNEIAIDKYGFGYPPVLSEDEFCYGLKYLDQTSGMIYSAKRNHPLDLPHAWTEWDEYKQLELITSSLESRIKQTLTGIELGVKNNDTGTSAGITIKVTSENGTVEEEKGEIVLNGLVSFTDLSTSGKTTIVGDNITTGAINANLITVGTLNGERVNTATLYLTDGLKFSYIDFDGTKKIRRAMSLEIEENITYPNLIVGGTSSLASVVFKNYVYCESEAYFSKRVDFDKGTYFWDAISVDGGIRLRHSDNNGNPLNQSINAIYKDGNMHDVITVNENQLTTGIGWNGESGSNSYSTVLQLRGKTVTAPNNGGITVQSDERLKNSFKPLDEFEDVYMDIKPCAFKYNNGSSGRYHFGAKAQDVKKAFERHGYTTKDFGGIVQMSDSPGNEDYCGLDDPMGIIYTEFTMWNMHMVQKLYKKIEEQKSEIDSLKESVSFLMGRVENYE